MNQPNNSSKYNTAIKIRIAVAICAFAILGLVFVGVFYSYFPTSVVNLLFSVVGGSKSSFSKKIDQQRCLRVYELWFEQKANLLIQIPKFGIEKQFAQEYPALTKPILSQEFEDKYGSYLVEKQKLLQSSAAVGGVNDFVERDKQMNLASEAILADLIELEPEYMEKCQVAIANERKESDEQVEKAIACKRISDYSLRTQCEQSIYSSFDATYSALLKKSSFDELTEFSNALFKFRQDLKQADLQEQSKGKKK